MEIADNCPGNWQCHVSQTPHGLGGGLRLLASVRREVCVRIAPHETCIRKQARARARSPGHLRRCGRFYSKCDMGLQLLNSKVQPCAAYIASAMDYLRSVLVLSLSLLSLEFNGQGAVTCSPSSTSSSSATHTKSILDTTGNISYSYKIQFTKCTGQQQLLLTPPHQRLSALFGRSRNNTSFLIFFRHR